VHSLNHIDYAHAVAAERTERGPRAEVRSGRHRPPPVRAAARLAARVALRLDADAARRAVA
jgi:hypothetical protein